MAKTKSYTTRFISELDERNYSRVLVTFKKGEEITASGIQIKCECGYHSAN